MPPQSPSRPRSLLGWSKACCAQAWEKTSLYLTVRCASYVRFYLSFVDSVTRHQIKLRCDAVSIVLCASYVRVYLSFVDSVTRHQITWGTSWACPSGAAYFRHGPAGLDVDEAAGLREVPVGERSGSTDIIILRTFYMCSKVFRRFV